MKHVIIRTPRTNTGSGSVPYTPLVMEEATLERVVRPNEYVIWILTNRCGDKITLQPEALAALGVKITELEKQGVL